MALAERLLDRSSLSAALLHIKYWHRSTREIPLNRGWSLKPSYINTILSSDQALELHFDYQLLSGRGIALDLIIYGTMFDDGRAVQSSGPVTLRLSHNPLARPLKDLVAFQSNAISRSVIQAGIGVLHDAEELFLRACGNPHLELGDIGFEHGAMYLETGWPSPVGAAMVFHSEAREFARDFARIYGEYNLGIQIPMTLPSSIDLWDVFIQRMHQLSEPGRKNPAFYRQFSDPNKDDLIKFLEHLNQTCAQRLSILSGERVRELLIAANHNILDVECYDFGNNGLMLVTHPLSSVWPAYKYIVEHI